MFDRLRPALRPIGIFLLCAVAFGVAAKLGLSVTLISKQVSPVWIPAGVGLASMLTFGPRYGPALMLGAVIANLDSGAALLPSLAIGFGNMSEALVGRWLLLKVGFDLRFERVRDVLALLVLSCVLSTALGAAIGVTALYLAGVIPGHLYGSAWMIWQVGDAMGALTVAPLILTLVHQRRQPLGRARLAELVALATAAVTLSVWIFNVPQPVQPHSQAFLSFPLVLWAALRFGTRGAALATVAVSVIATIATASGRGPFAQATAIQGVVVLQTFMAVVALSGHLLAAAFAERREAHARVLGLAEAVRSIQDGILITDPQARITFANEGFSRVFGYSQAELLGKPAALLNHELSDPGAVARVGVALREGRPIQEEGLMRRKDGTAVEAELRIWPVRSPGGELVQFVGTFRDVTERRRMQGRLMTAEKMATMGTIAAGVAHEINNPLSFVLTNIQFAQREVLRFQPAEIDRIVQVSTALQNAAEGADRVTAIVKDLKVFSRQRDERLPLALDLVAERAVAIAANEVRHRARLTKELAPNVQVNGNEGRLVQVVLNLVVNAAHAIPEGRGDEQLIRLAVRAEGPEAVIEVSDTGVGIPPELLTRIFEPFFTTKTSYGTGLGLAICHQIVTEHHGQIAVESTVGKGTKVTVRFPRVEAPAEAGAVIAAESSDREQAPARARILVVDDEPRIGESIRRLLEPEHEVTALTSGEEALGRLTRGERFDVIFCDLQMPGASGMDVHARLSEDAPELAERIVFVSGGAFTPAAQAFVSEVPNLVLDKPVKGEVLHRAVERMLDRARVSASK